MNQYEVGTHHPNLQTTMSLCKVLGLSPAFLYCEDDDLSDIILTYSTLPKKRKSELYQIAESLREQN